MRNAGNLHGGARANAGRKPDWLKEKCAKILDQKKLLNYLAGVASGEETEQEVVVIRDRDSASTEVVEVRCSTKDRLRAIEMIMDRGFGKPKESMDINLNVDLADRLQKAWERASSR